MPRRTRLLLFLLVALVGLVLGLPALVRQEVAEFAIARALAARGLEGRVEVSRLDLAGIELSGLEIADLRARRVLATYRLRDLMAGRIARVDIEGLQMRLDLTGAGPPLGELQKLLGKGAPDEGAGAGGPDPASLPDFHLRDARLELVTARGLVTASLDAAFAAAGAGRQALELTLDLEGAGAELAGELRANFVGLAPQSLDANFRLLLPEHGGRADVTLATGQAATGPRARVSLSGEVDGTVARLFAPASDAWPGFGRISFTGDGQIDLAGSAPALGEGSALAAWLGRAAMELTLTLALRDGSLQGVATGADLDAVLRLSRREGRSELALSEAARLRIGAIDAQAIEASGLPPALARTLSREITLAIEPRSAAPAFALGLEAHRSADADLTFRLDAGKPGELAIAGTLAGHGTAGAAGQAGEAALDLRLEGRILAEFLGPGAALDRLQAMLRLRATGDARGLAIDLAGPGELSLEGLRLAELAVPGRLVVALSAAALARDADGTLRLEGAARAEPLALSLRRKGEPPLQVRAGPADLSGRLSRSPDGVFAGEASLRLAEAEFPAFGLKLGNLRAVLPPSPAAGPLLVIEGGRLSSTASPAAFPPLEVKGRVERNLAFRAEATALEGRVRVAAQGRHDAARGRGSASIELRGIDFVPDKLQPTDLLPALTAMQEVRGRVGANARLAWDPSGVDGTGRIEIQGLSLTAAGATIEDVSLSLDLDRLNPLRSPPGQPFSVGRMSAGLDLRKIQGTLRVESEPQGIAAIRVESMKAEFVGGELRLAGARVDPVSGSYGADLELEGIDLEALFALLGLEELHGSGRISGTLPVQLKDGDVIVTRGRLAGIGPGRVAFDSPAARSALGSGGATVELLLDALKNFHYEVLELTVDKPRGGRAKVGLRLQGANPDVLEAHPFNLNITLDTDATPLLAALAQGQDTVQLLLGNVSKLVRRP